MICNVYGLRTGCFVDSRSGTLDELWEWFNQLGPGYRGVVLDGSGSDASAVCEWRAD